MFAHSSVNAAGIGQAEVELSGDSLVGGPPTALLCLPFFSHYAHSHVSSDAIKNPNPQWRQPQQHLIPWQGRTAGKLLLELSCASLLLC